MRKLAYFTLAAVAALATTVVVATAPKSAVHAQMLGNPTETYECNSIHFGMDDNTLQGQGFGGGTNQIQSISKAKYETTYGTNDLISSISSTGSMTMGSTSAYKYALKLGAGSKTGSVTFELTSNILGLTLYLCRYNTDTGNLTVTADKSYTVNKNDITAVSSSTVGSTVETLTYMPYRISFTTPTDTFTIATTAKRMFIGDIALRVAL